MSENKNTTTATAITSNLPLFPCS